MLKKTITYKDLDGNDITEDFYFSLSKAELAEMQLSENGGLKERLVEIIASKDQRQIIQHFKSIIRSTVGRRSEDGKRFEKSERIADEFMQTDAYSVLFMELLTDVNKGAEFIRAVIPSDLSARLPAIDEIHAETAKHLEHIDVTDGAPTVKRNRKQITDYSIEELTDMPSDEFRMLMHDAKGNVPMPIVRLAMQRSHELK